MPDLYIYHQRERLRLICSAFHNLRSDGFTISVLLVIFGKCVSEHEPLCNIEVQVLSDLSSETPIICTTNYEGYIIF